MTTNDYLIKNKRILFDYNVHQTFDAGIALTGCEVKSIRENHIGINDCYVVVKNNEVLVLNWNIPKYKQAFKNDNYDPRRPKKLLLKKEEIKKIIGSSKRSGYSIVISEIYTNEKGFFKFKLALVTSKKKYDKRQYIREKDERREKTKKII